MHLGRLDLLPDPLKRMLFKIEDAPYHSLPAAKLRATDRPVVKNLLDRGWVRLVPESERFPAHYTLTSGGSYAIDTFAYSRLARRVVARWLERVR